MGELTRLEMIEPGTGRHCMVLERDRKAFERAGYAPVDEMPAAVVPEVGAEPVVEVETKVESGEATTLPVQSRAFEQPDRPAVGGRPRRKTTRRRKRT